VQGRRGEVAAELLTDFPERFRERRRLYLTSPRGLRRELELESHWPHRGAVVLKFRGVDSISDAETLVGCEIQIPRAERVTLPENQVYVADLLGCTVVDTVSGAELGRIEDVQSGSGEALLLVVKAGAKEYLVPFAAEFLGRLDLERKRIEMALPQGLLELDAPLTEAEKRAQRDVDEET